MIFCEGNPHVVGWVLACTKLIETLLIHFMHFCTTVSNTQTMGTMLHVQSVEASIFQGLPYTSGMRGNAYSYCCISILWPFLSLFYTTSNKLAESGNDNIATQNLFVSKTDEENLR